MAGTELSLEALYPGFGPLGVESLEKAFRVDLTRIRRLGEDFLLEARLD